VIVDAPAGNPPARGDAAPPPIQTDLVAWYAEGFTDRFGDRLLLFDNTGPALELLRLNPQLAAVPGFEAALRARVEELKTFSHPLFARVRCVTTLDDPRPHLALVSELVPGERLSQVLRTVELHDVRPDPGAAVWLIRQLLPAVAALHQRGEGVAHGLLGCDRIVVTPEGGLAITEYVLAEGVERLGLSVADLWQQFGIAARDTAEGPRLDAASDLMQMGLLALSVLLGRPLRDDEYPARVGALLDEACSSQHWTLSPMLRPWLARALGVGATPFASLAEAEAQLDLLLPGVAGGWSPRLLPRPDEPSLAAPGWRPLATLADRGREEAGDAARAVRPPGPPVAAPQPGRARPQPIGSAATRGRYAASHAEQPTTAAADRQAPEALMIARLRRRVAVLGLLAGAEAAALLLLIAVSPWTAPATPAAVVAPGHDSSLTTVSEPASDLRSTGDGRPQAVSASVGAGWLAVSSEIPVTVHADGELLGSTTSGRFQLRDGDHLVVVANQALGYRLAQKVRIQPGRTMRITTGIAQERPAGPSQLPPNRPPR
jgi:hypothetical protein